MSQGYNTNLAAEFYVLSMLHRLGLDANLTLGNKKSVDIAVVCGPGEALTIDVKGLKGRTAWPVDNFKLRPDHFLAFVCFNNKISDPKSIPDVWILPSSVVPKFIYKAPNANRKVVRRGVLDARAADYYQKWDLLGRQEKSK